MNTPKSEFSQKLLSLDDAVPADRTAYERKAAALFETGLRGGALLQLVLMGVGGLAGAVVCGALAITEPAGMPLATRVLLMLLSAIGLGWCAMAGFIWRRGSIDSAVHGGIAARMGFAVAVLATIGIAVLAMTKGSPVPAPAILLPLAMLTVASVNLVVHHIRQAELRQRKAMLEIEYRMAVQHQAL